jgi:hypothetical protein
MRDFDTVELLISAVVTIMPVIHLGAAALRDYTTHEGRGCEYRSGVTTSRLSTP